MQKLYYSIREVSLEIKEEPHILRYWEKEFPQLKPKKNRGGKRIYSEKDVNIVRLIQTLLRDKKLSLKGAQEQLKLVLDSGGRKDEHSFTDLNFNLRPPLKPVNEEEAAAISKKDLSMIIEELKRLSLRLRS